MGRDGVRIMLGETASEEIIIQINNDKDTIYLPRHCLILIWQSSINKGLGVIWEKMITQIYLILRKRYVRLCKEEWGRIQLLKRN